MTIASSLLLQEMVSLSLHDKWLERLLGLRGPTRMMWGYGPSLEEMGEDDDLPRRATGMSRTLDEMIMWQETRGVHKNAYDENFREAMKDLEEWKD
jgi:hypothetical protein